MKRMRRVLFGLLALLLLAQPAAAVQAQTPAAAGALVRASVSGAQSSDSVKLSRTSVKLVYGKTTTIRLKNAPARVAWYSSNKKIAYCDNGKIEAKAVGTATITAKCSGRSYKCKVTVTSGESTSLKKSGHYTGKKMVVKYIRKYNRLPENFITKKEAGELGWKGGSLIPYRKDACIGGDVFKDYDGQLEAAPGRVYYECDIDTMGALSRGSKRLVFSNDGLIYYTADHYETFELLD